MLAPLLWISVAFGGIAEPTPGPSADMTIIAESKPSKPRWWRRGRGLLIGIGIGLGIVAGAVLVGWILGGPEGALTVLVVAGVLLLLIGLLILKIRWALAPQNSAAIAPPPPVAPTPGQNPSRPSPAPSGPSPRTPSGQTTPPPPRGTTRPRPE